MYQRRLFFAVEINAYNNVLELIGNTPLIKLNKVTENLVAEISMLRWKL
jgi:hypothetical protein